MRKPLEIFCRGNICKEQGHKFSERKIKDREGVIFVEYMCLRCRKTYQETPTALEMEKFYDDTKGLFV